MTLPSRKFFQGHTAQMNEPIHTYLVSGGKDSPLPNSRLYPFAFWSFIAHSNNQSPRGESLAKGYTLFVSETSPPWSTKEDSNAVEDHSARVDAMR